MSQGSATRRRGVAVTAIDRERDSARVSYNLIAEPRTRTGK